MKKTSKTNSKFDSMTSKLTIGILLGGKSPEHEISIKSAKNIFAALDKNQFNTKLIYISKQGSWYSISEEDLLKKQIEFVPKNELAIKLNSKGTFFKLAETQSEFKIDIIIPAIHGPNCEDGSIQGFLKTLDIPFVGTDILGSAICMDKVISKQILKHNKIPVAEFTYLNSKDKIPTFVEIKSKLGIPFFIKPANLGSSIGISKIRNQKEFETGITNAFKYDNKIILEQNITGRELECSVLEENNQLSISTPGELIIKSDFYDYEEKYSKNSKTKIQIPASLDKKTQEKVKKIVAKAYKTLNCKGFSRVDLFLTKDNKVFINEINTLPGFTDSSMFPQMLNAEGISNQEILTRLIKTTLDTKNQF